MKKFILIFVIICNTVFCNNDNHWQQKSIINEYGDLIGYGVPMCKTYNNTVYINDNFQLEIESEWSLDNNITELRFDKTIIYKPKKISKTSYTTIFNIDKELFNLLINSKYMDILIDREYSNQHKVSVIILDNFKDILYKSINSGFCKELKKNYKKTIDKYDIIVYNTDINKDEINIRNYEKF